MGLEKVLDVILMPPGFGGYGLGKGPFERSKTKKDNKARDAELAAKQSQTPAPQAPTPESAAIKGQDQARQKKKAATQSVYSSPLGLQGEANVVRKNLTGQ